MAPAKLARFAYCFFQSENWLLNSESTMIKPEVWNDRDTGTSGTYRGHCYQPLVVFTSASVASCILAQPANSSDATAARDDADL